MVNLKRFTVRLFEVKEFNATWNGRDRLCKEEESLAPDLYLIPATLLAKPCHY